MVPSTEVKILLTLFVFICLTLYNIAFKESNAVSSTIKRPYNVVLNNSMT